MADAPTGNVATDPLPNIAAMSSAQAAARLQERTADPEWGAKVTSGSGPETRELTDLLAKKNEGEATLDNMISGSYQTTGGEVSNLRELSPQNTMKFFSWLRDAGISDDAMKQLHSGEPVSRDEYEVVQQYEKMLMTDPAWTKKLLDGGHEERRDLLLIKIALRAGHK